MRKLVSATGWLMLGAVLALALLEVALRLLPVAMGLYRTQRYEEWPLQSYEPDGVTRIRSPGRCATRIAARRTTTGISLRSIFGRILLP